MYQIDKEKRNFVLGKGVCSSFQKSVETIFTRNVEDMVLLELQNEDIQTIMKFFIKSYKLGKEAKVMILSAVTNKK